VASVVLDLNRSAMLRLAIRVERDPIVMVMMAMMLFSRCIGVDVGHLLALPYRRGSSIVCILNELAIHWRLSVS